MGTEVPQIRGVLFLDGTGSIVLARGNFRDTSIQLAVVQKWKREGSDQGRILALRSAGKELAVLSIPSDEGTLFVDITNGANKALFEFVASVPFADDILEQLLTDPYDAMTIVDADGILRFMSPVHRRFFGLDPGEGVGKHVTEVVENTRLHEVVRTGKAEIGHTHEMRGATRIVTRIPIRSREGRVVGAVGRIMFRGPEHLQALSSEVSRLRNEVAFYRRELGGLRNRTYGIAHIVGNSPAIRRLKAEIQKIAPLDVPVLLVGESGTGKELVAHAIHMLSARRGRAMVLVNAAALPATLVESELFGYESGAFTGAERKGRKGKFEQADESTLFFDEIGDMPLEIQGKLLRVLQDGVFERVGGERGRASNFRLISASNRDFQKMIAEGTFRLDLYYRVSAVTVQVPPLRERLDDIPLIVESALNAFAARHGTEPKRVEPETIAYLMQQPWPGNVRQLIHAVERGAIFAEGNRISKDDLGPLPTAFSSSEAELPPIIHEAPGAKSQASSVKDAVSKLEGDLIREAMVKFGGNKQRVAAELGISRSYLYKRLAELSSETTDG